METLIAVYPTTRLLDVADQHAITPEAMLIRKSTGLADDGTNDVGPDNADPRDSHEIADGPIVLFVFFEEVSVLQFFLF
jgi:hypothetical protein